MRRIVVLLAVVAMMTVMMATSASPAFALNRGQLVSAFTQSLHANPPDPVHPRGQQVSEFAHRLSDDCTPEVNVDCPPGHGRGTSTGGGTGHGGGGGDDG